jgi:hypothetical protein
LGFQEASLAHGFEWWASSIPNNTADFALQKPRKVLEMLGVFVANSGFKYLKLHEQSREMALSPPPQWR